MKKFGLILALLGVVATAGSCVPFGAAILRAFDTETPAATVHLPEGATRRVYFRVDTPGTARLALKLDVRTTSVQERRENHDRRYLPRYRFPISYTVRDAHGRVVHTGGATFEWREFALDWNARDEAVDKSGGALSVERTLGDFDVAAPGRFEVEIVLGPDTDYAAEAGTAALMVYAGVMDVFWLAVTWALMFFAGAMIALLGFILFLVASGGAQPAAAPAEAPDRDARMWAMLAHVAALLAYVGLPFGHILGPLVVYLAKRDSAPFVADQGRESLNFQISITFYTLLALVLCFILIGFPLLVILFLFHVVFTLVAALRASEGRAFRYPLNLRLIK